MYYKRPYCPDCKLIWGEAAISKVTQCSKCGVNLILEDFNPYTKSLLGILVIVAGCLTFFIKEIPVIWWGGAIWGLFIIGDAFQNWFRIKAIDKNTQEKRFYSILQPIKAFLNHRKYSIIVCLKCTQKLRVPKIKKKLIVTCPKCKNSFTITPAPFLSRLFCFLKN